MRLAFATAILCLATPVLAGEIVLSSRITAVTLYPDGATVTRSLDFSVPAGDSTLVLSDFPTSLDPGSIRLAGAGNTAVAIGAVDSKIVYLRAPGDDAAIESRLRDLRDERAGIEGELSALETKRGFIERIAGTADIVAGGDKTAPLDPAMLRATWTVVGEDLAAVNDAILKARLRLRTTDEAIARAEAEASGRNAGEQRTELRIALSAPQAASGSLSIAYLVSEARWAPSYDARLDTGSGTLEIVRRAEVRQSTGEDWGDVALTISTARATAGAAAPQVATRIVSFLEPPRPAPLADALRAGRPALEAEAQKALDSAYAEAEPAAPVAAAEQEATLDTGGFQSVWTVPGRVDVASGPATRTLRLETMTVKPDIVARAVPSIDPTAYLEAAFIHEDETPLFSGPAAIYRDGLYAGRAALAMAARGETVRLGFGADDLIRIERIAARRQQSETGIVSTSRNDSRDYEIRLQNGRTTTVRVLVEEAVPVSETEDIEVAVSRSTTPPDKTDADGRRGVFAWIRDLAPGAQETILVGYTISWPADRQIDMPEP